MTDIDNKDFYRLVDFMKKKYGINLEKKRHIISGRLSTPIASMGFSGFSDYVDHILTTNNNDDIDFLINKLTTNYTFFMREKAHFEFFKDNILPELEKKRKNKVLSIWSAGCSTGQEAYTLSMLMKEHFGNRASEWDTRILATDISQRVLTEARNGIYPEESLKELPASWKNKYFSKTKDGSFAIKPIIKDNVIYKTFNLMDPIDFKLKFDVIFCRNVMIYFNQETKDRLTNRFYDSTVPGGYLLVGHSESITRSTSQYKYIMPAVYRKF